MAKREKRTEITQDMVLQRWWDLANADANEPGDSTLGTHKNLHCRCGE